MRINKDYKREILSIPNILGYFRILLIPLFMYLYLNGWYYWAGSVILISGITDMLDGKIARKFNMITELGKILDPVADKLTHGAITLCLVFRVPYFYMVLVVFVAKEAFMVMGNVAALKKRGRKLDGAKWYGKVMTTILYVSLYLLILFPNMGQSGQQFLTTLCFAAILITWVLYVPVFYRMLKTES